MNFGLILCTLVDLISVYIKIFCPKFLKLRSVIFQFFLKNGLHGARAPFKVFLVVVDKLKVVVLMLQRITTLEQQLLAKMRTKIKRPNIQPHQLT
jgi:hypothetical protein